MEDFKKKVVITEPMEVFLQETSSSASPTTVHLLHRFLGIQQRRAEAYARLKSGFDDYMVSGGELAYQQLCSEITMEFNDCSKQVIEMESLLQSPDHDRPDLAIILRAVQVLEKEKLQQTAAIQVLKKAGRPSERLVSHGDCRFKKSTEHECMHIHEITEAAGTEEAEAEAEYSNALKEAIRGVQNAVTTINDRIEEVRYEIAALQAE